MKYFTRESSCIIYGTHVEVAQNMLDYDFLIDRAPSVVAFFSNGEKRNHKLFYGQTECIIPTITERHELSAYPKTTILINMASYRSCTAVTKQALQTQHFSDIFTIAEGVPERETRELIVMKSQYPQTKLYGPSIVGCIIAGCLRVGHAGGSLDNILQSKLHLQGSVGIVSKSGGMMNELCRIVSHSVAGVHSAMQVGGDRYAMTTLTDIVLSYEQNPDITAIVVLGEVGNTDELKIADMISSGEITKPLIIRCAGTVAQKLSSNIQFGHAGAMAKEETESAAYKNQYLRQAGAYVPESFDTFGKLIAQVTKNYPYNKSSREINIEEKVNMMLSRKKTKFTSTISDERGEELLYNGIPLSKFVESQSIGRLIGHLRMKQELPPHATKFLTTALILLADHGPAVSGAVNTIVTARAGKDLVSSLIAGLSTIGERFGGAIDGAASWLHDAVILSKSAEEIINEHKSSGKMIQGIGHKVKSKFNPDVRCQYLDKLAQDFSSHQHLSVAKAVESLTLQKKQNLILNVDGYVGALLLDMLVDIGISVEQRTQYVQTGLGNAIFVLARSIGFIGHYLDQQRLGEGLYRTPREDILYTD